MNSQQSFRVSGILFTMKYLQHTRDVVLGNLVYCSIISLEFCCVHNMFIANRLLIRLRNVGDNELLSSPATCAYIEIRPDQTL